MRNLWDEARIREEIARLDRITGLNGASLPIVFGRAHQELGSFHPERHGRPMHFRFSLCYLQDEQFTDKEALELIRHEYAHFMDWVLYNGAGHGQTWKKCCRVIGVAPQRLYSSRYAESIRAIQSREDELAEEAESIPVGASIIHPKHGNGVVTSSTGDGRSRVLTIDFGKKGMRMLLAIWVIEKCEWKA